MKTVLFVPGFKEDIDLRPYNKTLRVIKEAGYKVTFVPISWDRTTIDQWVKELREVYDHYDPKETILAGFSYGAMTAFVAAAERSPAEVWLFSLSPYFKEDLESGKLRASWLKSIGHRRVSSFRRLEFSKLIKNTSSTIIFFYGEKELESWPPVEYRRLLVAKLSNAKEVFIPHATHDVTSDDYLSAIKAVVKK